MVNINKFLTIQYDVYSHILLLAKDILHHNILLNSAYNKKNNCFSYLICLEPDQIEKALSDKGFRNSLLINLTTVNKDTDIDEIVKQVKVSLIKYRSLEFDISKFFDDHKLKYLVENHFYDQLAKNLDIIAFLRETNTSKMFQPSFKIIDWGIESIEPLIEPLIPQ